MAPLRNLEISLLPAPGGDMTGPIFVLPFIWTTRAFSQSQNTVSGFLDWADKNIGAQQINIRSQDLIMYNVK
jgi:hypothetical protein